MRTKPTIVMRKRDRPPTVRRATTELPTAASHPFCARRNRLLAAQDSRTLGAVACELEAARIYTRKYPRHWGGWAVLGAGLAGFAGCESLRLIRDEIPCGCRTHGLTDQIYTPLIDAWRTPQGQDGSRINGVKVCLPAVAWAAVLASAWTVDTRYPTLSHPAASHPVAH